MEEINIYCDESNHLENDGKKIMVLGAVYCPKNEVRFINERIKEIKEKHGLPRNVEIKWKRVSSGKLMCYRDIIDYFFDKDSLHFRAVVINKTELDHKSRGQTHDEWYYKMYFELLSKILDPDQKYNIYLDTKDTRGRTKIKELHEVLSSNMYDFERKIIRKIQEIRSFEVQIVQLTDILIGALQFSNSENQISEAKSNLVKRIKERSGYDLSKSTLVKEPKFNIFHWRGSGADTDDATAT